MIDKLFATWWAISTGIAAVQYMFHHDERPWSWVGVALYFLLFIATLYQIRKQQTVWEWMWKRYKRRQGGKPAGH